MSIFYMKVNTTKQRLSNSVKIVNFVGKPTLERGLPVAVIQFSSATTVMLIGFAGAGMMTLQQAVWGGAVDAGVLFIVLLSNFEKIGDDCFNIAIGGIRIQ